MHRGLKTWGRWTRPILASAMALAALCSPAAAQTPLRWRFTSGETVQYVITLQSANRSADGAAALNTTMQVGLQQKVESVDETGVATITQTIPRIQVRIDAATGSSEYDTTSGKKPDGMTRWMAPMLHAVLNKPVRFKMSPLGQISELKLVKGKMEEIQEAVKGDELGRLFTEAGIGEALGFVNVLEQPLYPGSRWPRAVVLENPVLGKQNIETVYTFQGMENRAGKMLARITSTSQTSFLAGEKQSATVRVREQTTSGTAYFDPALGKLVESEQKSQMRLQVSFSGNTLNQNMEMTRRVLLIGGGATSQ